MTKEQLEKAAVDYVQLLPFGDDFHDLDIERAYRAGANWRINSVWHDAKEKAEEGSLIFIESRRMDVFMEYFYGEWNEMVRKYVIKRWAYMTDLLPEE